jgi:hypothetical protein
MHTMRAGLTILTMILASGSVFAQERPDFSGTWVAERPAGTAGSPAPVLVYGAEFTIDHKGSALTARRPFGGQSATINYVLDGSETTSRMPGRLCEPDSGATWSAAWDGSTIAISMLGALPANGQPVKMDVKSTLRLESPELLRVSVTSRLPGQAEPRTNTTLYKRSGPPPIPAAARLQKARATLAQVDWISGVWVGTSGTATFEERWTPGAGGSMMAVARSLRNGLMSSFEFLCIVERDGGLVYQAMPNGRQPATDFTLTGIDSTSATFENPDHDFPKMIRYTRRPDGTLEAVVSGAAGQRPQTFVFKRQSL